MGECDVNKRHQKFKRELRAYHDAINRTNRYSLPRIMGKLNMFEAIESSDSDEITTRGNVERKIPGTGLTVLKRDDLYAIGDYDGNPLTEFKYQFIEGCLGEHDKIIRCVTDDGDIEDFSVESETILENAPAMVVGASAAPMQTSGMGVGGMNSGKCGNKDYTEIDYSDVREQLNIPFLCGARVVDVNRHNRRKKRRRTRRSV